MHGVLFLLLLLCLPTVGWSNDVACDDPARIPRVIYLLSQEPSSVTNPQCSIIPEANTEQQRALVTQHALTPYYLKTQGTAPNALVVEMDATEKGQVDTVLAAEAAKQQAWATEVATPGVCKYNLPAEIDQKTAQVKQANQNNINALSLSQADKDLLITVTNRLSEGLGQLATCDAARAGGG